MKGHARNMMSTPVVSVGPEASLTEIARCLAAARIGGVPVVGTDGRVEGFVSESDLLDAMLQDRTPTTRAADLMTRSVFSVNEFDRTEEVMSLLRQHRIHHSERPEETDSHYGFFLSIWDRLLGTWRGAHQGELVLGVRGWRAADQQGLVPLLAQPFRRSAPGSVRAPRGA